ncbi:MAG: hypothetical protein JWM25_518 [Thermoleophilia bacterium]|nr:hypothetical protein [Thermoleophilia bacterium]
MTARSSIGQTARVGGAAARYNLQIAIHYRANAVIWFVASLLQIVVALSVWRAVAAANGGSAGGLDGREFAGYFLVLMVVQDLTHTQLPYTLPWQVRTGALSSRLLRPVHPLFYYRCGEFGFTAQRMLLLIPAAAMLFFVYDARLDLTLGGAGIGLIALLMAMVVRTLLEALVGMTALWLVRIDGFHGLYMVVMLFLGGQFAPLSVLPEPMQVAAKALPFWWTMGYPTELLAGTSDLSTAWVGLFVLLAWSVVLLTAVRHVWRRGTTALEAVGS